MTMLNLGLLRLNDCAMSFEIVSKKIYSDDAPLKRDLQ